MGEEIPSSKVGHKTLHESQSTNRLATMLMSKFYCCVTQNPRVTLTLAYLLSWGALVLSSGSLFWDDWIWMTSDRSSILEQLVEAGLPSNYILFIDVFQQNAHAARLITLVLLWLCAQMFYSILLRVPLFGANAALVCAAFSAVLPLHTSRGLVSTSQYTVALTLFLLAWVLLTGKKYISTWRLFVSAPLFFLSFTMQSLLVFFLLPLMHFFEMYSSNKARHKKFLLSLTFLASLPIGFFILKRLYFSPFGVYKGYLSIDLTRLVPIALLTFGLMILFIISWKMWLSYKTKGARLRCLGMLSLFAVALAVLPYIAVGHVPPYVGHNSRNAILLLISVPIGLVSLLEILRLFVHRTTLILCGTALMVLFMVFSIDSSLRYRTDWLKQLSLMQQFDDRESELLADLVIIRDETESLNVDRTGYSFYAWNGLLKRATGVASRFALSSPRDWAQYTAGAYTPYFGPNGLDYGAQDFRGSSSVTLVTITTRDAAGEDAPQAVTISEIRTMPLERFDSEMFWSKMGK